MMEVLGGGATHAPAFFTRLVKDAAALAANTILPLPVRRLSLQVLGVTLTYRASVNRNALTAYFINPPLFEPLMAAIADRYYGPLQPHALLLLALLLGWRESRNPYHTLLHDASGANLAALLAAVTRTLQPPLPLPPSAFDPFGFDVAAAPASASEGAGDTVRHGYSRIRPSEFAKRHQLTSSYVKETRRGILANAGSVFIQFRQKGGSLKCVSMVLSRSKESRSHGRDGFQNKLERFSVCPMTLRQLLGLRHRRYSALICLARSLYVSVWATDGEPAAPPALARLLGRRGARGDRDVAARGASAGRRGRTISTHAALSTHARASRREAA